MSKGWAIERLATEIDTAGPVVSNLERGVRNPSRGMVTKLATALGVDPSPGLRAAGFLPEGDRAEPVNEAFDDDLNIIVGAYKGADAARRRILRATAEAIREESDEPQEPRRSKEIGYGGVAGEEDEG